MRALGLDVGSVRIGVALSDETCTIATPHGTLNAREGDKRITDALREICRDHEVSLIVVGMPLSMSGGDRGESARRARQLGEALEEQLAIPVVYLDERFTSTQAERSLVDANLSRARRKNKIDKVAAALILQAFLDSREPHDPA